MSSAQTVLLLGATGTAGSATATALRDAGHHVIAYGRRAPQIDGIESVVGPLNDSEALAAAFAKQPVGAVVSCITSRNGTPQTAWAVDYRANLDVLKAAQAAHVERFVLMSAICVQKPQLAFQQAKLAFEAELMNAPLTYSIVRPTAFFKSLSGQFDRVRSGKPYVMFGNGRLTNCKPISDRDLGRYMAGCLTNPDCYNAVLPIGGPGPALSPRDMGEALFEILGMKPKFRSVSPNLIGTIAGGLSLAGKLIPSLATKAELAKIGKYYATESMLLWDESTQSYDADATPETGKDTLFDYYIKLASGKAQLDRGAHAVF